MASMLQWNCVLNAYYTKHVSFIVLSKLKKAEDILHKYTSKNSSSSDIGLKHVFENI